VITPAALRMLLAVCSLVPYAWMPLIIHRRVGVKRCNRDEPRPFPVSQRAPSHVAAGLP
jgi:hypothetical protein